jgi:DNA-binding response OmpR family regulator
MANLLLVEDDETIGRLVESALRANGHTASWQQSGRSALDAADHERFDLILLDLGLPDIDGVEVCRDLRTRQPGSVLVMLTARRDEMDVVVGLEAGADDYLTKPFGLTELLARVRAHLRRRSVNRTPDGHDDEPFVSGDLVLDGESRRCLVAGTEVALRAKEFDLLSRLAAQPGQAVSRDTLMTDVWDENWFGSTKTLDVHIASLRRRLVEAAESADPPARIPVITTLRGHGYRLEPMAGHASD